MMVKSKKELKRMTKDELKEFAKDEHDIELSTNNLKKEMIDKLVDERSSKRSTTKNFIITLAVVLGIFAVILGGIKIMNASENKPYNGFPFEKNGMLWVTTAQKGNQPYKIPFYHHPSTLEDIIAQEDAEQVLLRKAQANPNTTVFITLEPELKSNAVVAAVEISRLTGDRYNILNLETHGALTSAPVNQTASAQNPIVTCENVNNETVVIWLKKGPQNVIHERKGCIILEGQTSDDVLRVADRFAYMLLGIMD